MRLTKMFGLAAVAAVAAMGFVGASSAMAEKPTAICKVHTSLVCPNGQEVASFTFKSETIIFKTSIATILCLTSRGKAELEGQALENPLRLKLTEWMFLECGTSGTHDNCIVTVLKFPLILVLKTALNLGTVTVNKALPAELTIKCGSLINCTYSEPAEGKSIAVEGALHTEGAGHGMLTANELEIEKTGGVFCPKTSKLTALYETLEHIYLLE